MACPSDNEGLSIHAGLVVSAYTLCILYSMVRSQHSSKAHNISMRSKAHNIPTINLQMAKSIMCMQPRRLDKRVLSSA